MPQQPQSDGKNRAVAVASGGGVSASAPTTSSNHIAGSPWNGNNNNNSVLLLHDEERGGDALFGETSSKVTGGLGGDEPSNVPIRTTFTIDQTHNTAPSSSSSPSSSYSSLMGAVFNFTNCIVGAGAIGLGGAIAQSGGGISIAAILFFAVLTKLSLDLVIDLSLQYCQGNTNNKTLSYEELGWVAWRSLGRNAVLCCKMLYSFGCLVAYLIVVKDNFSSALQHLIFGTNHHQHEHDPVYQFLNQSSLLTFGLSMGVLLPLCLLRDMSPLTHLSFLSVLSMTVIVFIVLYLFWAEPNIRLAGNGVYVNWFQIRHGVLESLGTFVFTFVSQHTVHLTFSSLRPDLRTLKTWKRVSLYSLCIATHISLAVGLAVYMTFWQASRSDFFQMYPVMRVIDVAKLLLCLSMLWTFPLPFFTCREVVIVVALLPPPPSQLVTLTGEDDEGDERVGSGLSNNGHHPGVNDESTLREPLLAEHETDAPPADNDIATPPTAANAATYTPVSSESRFLLPGNDRQLVLVYHVLLTVILWALATTLAIVAPSLGDVLNLVGCATGTLIAFILPALFSFRLQGYNHLAMFILVVGGAVGIIGTYFSLRKIFG